MRARFKPTRARGTHRAIKDEHRQPHVKRPATHPATTLAPWVDRPSVARGGFPGAVRRLPDGTASRGAARLPGKPPRAIKWVIIIHPWYYTDLQ